jgi:arylsulfatase A
MSIQVQYLLNVKMSSNRRIIFFLFVSILTFQCKEKKVEIAKNGKNYILIMADDIGFESFEFYGGSSYSTPNINFLAENGKIFLNAYSLPLCSPARASLITGRYNNRNYNDFVKPLEVTNEETYMGELFRKKGYATGTFGKWGLNSNLLSPFVCGFDEYFLYGIGSGSWGLPYYDNHYYEDGDLVVNRNQYGPDLVQAKLFSFIDRNKESPFFIYYPMVLPHTNWTPTPDSKVDFGKQDIRYYPDMVAYMDKLIGNLVAYLDQNNILDETTILFTADNGTSQAIENIHNGKKVYGGKTKSTEYGIHVPLVVYNGDNTFSGTIDSTLVGITDYYATFNNLLNSNQVAVKDGVSFLNRIDQTFEKNKNIREWNFIYHDARRDYNPVPKSVFIFDRRYKLYDNGKFFDFKNDIHEQEEITSFTAKQKNIYLNFKKVLDSLNVE